jgi:hypothetical protein
MGELATNFFQNLFTVNNEVQPDVVVDAMTRRVSSQMNDNLYKDISMDEIQKALFHIGPHKAPGPDGFPACFFQNNWDNSKMKSALVSSISSKLE